MSANFLLIATKNAISQSAVTRLRVTRGDLQAWDDSIEIRVNIRVRKIRIKKCFSIDQSKSHCKMNKTLMSLKHYRKSYVRAFYGRHGRSTGINPGVMWPRKEELMHIKQYEAAFCPKLEDLIAENEAKKQARLQARKEREEEVLRNLEKLPGAFKSFFEKIEAKKKEREEFIRQREALVEEVREILGFRAKPSDERFQQALAQREEEEIKAKKKELRKKRENIGLEEMLAGMEKK